MKWTDYRVDSRGRIDLDTYATAPDAFAKKDKEKLIKKTAKNLAKIAILQEKLYADAREGLVIVLQAMDAAGKDSTIKHVFSSMNPQGIDVYPFKSPTSTELSYDYLHRVTMCLPPRGKIAVFNRSHYEDVLVVKVHNLHHGYHMPERLLDEDIFDKRYRHIRHFESYLYDNALRVVKIYLNVSKQTQKERFIERMDTPEKNWKFASGDLTERSHWDEYRSAYADAIGQTASEHSPWFIVPADKKWYTRYIVSEIVRRTLEQINPEYPDLPEDEVARIPTCRAILEQEDE